jgi:hypothetical protein
MIFSVDYGKYSYLHRLLDDIAFESAEIAAYGADENEARLYAAGRMEHAVKKLRNVKVIDYRCEVYFADGFAVANIRLDVENLFRFPFSPVTSIVVESQR